MIELRNAYKTYNTNGNDKNVLDGDSFEEAWKLAKSRGYSRRNYKR